MESEFKHKFQLAEVYLMFSEELRLKLYIPVHN